MWSAAGDFFERRREEARTHEEPLAQGQRVEQRDHVVSHPFTLSGWTGFGRAFLLREQERFRARRSRPRGRVRAVETASSLVQVVVPDPEPGSGGCEHFIGECAGG